METRQDPIQPGVVLGGRYKIGQELGRGAMALVFSAEDAMLKREVAIKITRTETLDDPTTPARMRREARTVGGLRHPHLITFHDFGEHLGRMYIVMERLHGLSLRAELDRSGRLEPRRAARIAGQVSGALGAAHDVGVIHRDLKPDNVFLVEGADDFAKLLDFSVAKVPEALSTGRITATGAVFGTPHYIAPEQAIGDPVSPRSDLYSLGVLLFEMIAGRPPFQCKNVIQLLTEQSTRDAPDVRTLAPDAPESLAHLLAVLLARSPADRPSSARDVEFLLRAAFDPRPAAAHGSAPAAAPAQPSKGASAPRAPGAVRVTTPPPPLATPRATSTPASPLPRPRPISMAMPAVRATPSGALVSGALEPEGAQDAGASSAGGGQTATPRPRVSTVPRMATSAVPMAVRPAGAAGGLPPSRRAPAGTQVEAADRMAGPGIEPGGDDLQRPPSRRTQPISTQSSRRTPFRRTQPSWSRVDPTSAAGRADAGEPPDAIVLPGSVDDDGPDR